MKPKDTEDPARLRELLRRGDPAGDGREPDPEEVRLLRARVLEAARGPAAGAGPAGAPGWRALALGWAAAACLIVLAGAGVLSLWRTVAPSPEAPAGAEAAEAPPRQVQFTTPGGTRIVWVLYPESP